MPASLKNLPFLFVFYFCVFTCTSCLDEENNPVLTKNITITQESTHELSLGMYGLEEGAVVEIKPAHAEVSEIVREKSGEIIYRYKPEPGYKGKDFAQIRAGKGSNGASENLFKITKINFLVAE